MGRPKKYPEGYDRHDAWKKRTGFEQRSDRKAYKAAWVREWRKRKKAEDGLKQERSDS